jgi:glycosyltransferase involved in cell wall biosynthesis
MGLFKIATNTKFVLLTQFASHDELAILDAPNARRVIVLGAPLKNAQKSFTRGIFAHVLPYLPERLRLRIGRVGSRITTLIKRQQSGSIVRDLKADLLFCPFTAPTYFESGIPAVCTIYDLQYKTYPDFFTSEDVAHRNATFRDSCSKASLLAAISDYSRISAIEHSNIDPIRIRTIHLRMAKRISPNAKIDLSVLDRLGLKSQRYLIYPANFWKHKNHEMLLTAFGIAVKNGLSVDIKLICTGAPGLRQEWLIHAAKTMNLKDRVLFPGYIPNQELAALMANCAGVIFPSLYEGFGLPVIEAMASGVPVACSNTTSLPEVASEAAILFNPKVPTEIADAIKNLVENQPLRIQLINAGLVRAKNFVNTEQMVQEYWKLFQEAIQTKIQVDQLTGFYEDGWIGKQLVLQAKASEVSRVLEIELFAPDWLPNLSELKVIVQLENGQKNKYALMRGNSINISQPIDSKGGNYIIEITPSFVPAVKGLGEDNRELSVILQKCTIIGSDGEESELFNLKNNHED